MPLHSALKGHGTFVYNAQGTLQRYTSNGGAGVGASFKAMGITSAWVRLFGVSGAVAHGPTVELVEALLDAKIELAGWGYCQGADWKADLKRSVEQSKLYGLQAFVADIEPGNSTTMGKTKWSRDDFGAYIDGIADRFGTENIAVSTWPVPKIQNAYDSVALMEIASPKVGAFAPQAYWMRFPKKIHYQATGFKESKYPKDNPEAFVRLVIDAWRHMGIENPLVITGQAYWGEGGPSQAVMEDKMSTFVSSYRDWDRIVGFNWWHAGGVAAKAMSQEMIATLTTARLDKKAYATA